MKESVLHIRISKEMKEELEKLVQAGLYSHVNEAIREVIRNTLRKYHDYVRK